MESVLIIDAKSLTVEDTLAVALDGRKVSLAEEARNRVKKSRMVLEKLIDSGKVMYGVNTGFGRFAEIIIPKQEIKELQQNIVLSHAAGVGEPLPDEIVRAVLLLKANSLASGYSGVRPVVIDTLIKMLNAGIYPIIPSKGSVGASGDLAPLAHMTLAALGLENVRVEGKKISAEKALSKAGIVPLELQAKEGLALLNGTQVMTAVGVLALHQAETLFLSGDIIGAMSVEALSGSLVPFDPRIHAARGQRGQIVVAANMRSLLQDSEILAKRPVSRVQEPYSLRCIPQVHGADRDALAYVRSILEREINGATDNPLIFVEDEEVLSGGNFHGEPLAIALDLLGIAASSLGGISERRIAKLMDTNMSGLPGFLATKQGLNSGFMLAQVTAAALVSENKVLAHPSSVDSIPTSANQEDYVSMGMTAATKALKILDNTEKIMAVELLCSSQGINLRHPLKPSPVLRKVHSSFRKIVPPLNGDRFLAPDIEKAALFIHSKNLIGFLPHDIQIN